LLIEAVAQVEFFDFLKSDSPHFLDFAPIVFSDPPNGKRKVKTTAFTAAGFPVIV